MTKEEIALEILMAMLGPASPHPFYGKEQAKEVAEAYNIILSTIEAKGTSE